jgi:hypothetical protein
MSHQGQWISVENKRIKLGVRCRALAWEGRNNWMFVHTTLHGFRYRALAWDGRNNWMFVHTTLHHLMEYVAHVEQIAVIWPWMTSPEEYKNMRSLPVIKRCISNFPDSLRNLIGNIRITLKFWTFRSYFQSANVYFCCHITNNVKLINWSKNTYKRKYFKRVFAFLHSKHIHWNDKGKIVPVLS